jgi:hypothetical protein
MMIMPWSNRKDLQIKSKAFVDFPETSGDITSPLESFLKGV